MPATLDSSSLGTPVPIGNISRELKKLWETGAGATTRASMVNFAVYCRGTEALAANTDIISRFTQNHACRALLICMERNAPVARAQAWINAHCHLSRAGAKQICCEQITFLLEGALTGRMTNIVFAHVDSDLPLYFWWQGDFSDQLNPHLWSWIDRLIIDSQTWPQPREQFRRLQASLAENKARLALRDINWTRSLYIRQALSLIFDHPENLPHLASLERVEIVHAPANRTTAVLLLGWLAGQLGWQLKSAEPIVFRTAAGGEIACSLRSEPGAAIGTFVLRARDAAFSLQRRAGERYLHTRIRLPDAREYLYLLPAGPDEIVDLLDEEMTRGTRHNIYLRALAAAEPLL
jgi:glucose-6-phosphate dehydrogenase assembly protein OpcA